MKEATKNEIERRGCNQKSDVLHTNSFMYLFLYFNLYFFLASHEALIILQRATEKAHPRKRLPVYLK